MELKLFEVRDHATFIPLLCIKPEKVITSSFEAEMVWRYGWKDSGSVIAMHLGSPDRCKWDPYEWGDRTFHAAHLHIRDNWNKLSTGDLIDVRVLLGETDNPCESEA